MKKQKPKHDLSVTFELVFLFLGGAVADVLLAHSVEDVYTGTLIGTAGLLAARRLLWWYLATRLLRFVSPFVIILLSGFLVHLVRREPLRPSKGRLTVGLLLCLLWYPTMIQNRTGFEKQCEINGYRGIRPMKAIALIVDINKDLNAPAPQPQTYYIKQVREDCGFIVHGGRYGHGSRRNVWEYTLNNEQTRDPIAQISYSDYHAAENLCYYSAHEIALYPNSGFVAAFDGGEMAGINDIETLFTLTRNGHIIARSTHPREKEMYHITMIVQRDGVVIGQICADDAREEWFSLGLNTEVWLEMSYEGKTVRVSNILQF